MSARPVDVLERLTALAKAIDDSNPCFVGGVTDNLFYAADVLAIREAVGKLIQADKWLDRCNAALDEHRKGFTESSAAGLAAGEAWAAVQLELHRTRDLAIRRRAAALAACGVKS
jgi:hypothetical protein